MPRRKLTEQEKADRKAKMEHKTALDNAKRGLRESLKECQEVLERGQATDPTYFFKVGDRVRWGNIDWVHVLEVLDNGRIYKLLKINSVHAYGKYMGERLDIAYNLWIHLRPYRTVEENKLIDILKENDDIIFQYGQRDMYSLLGAYYRSHGGIDMNPDYQRDLVWNPSQENSLIDSIYRNIDIGKFTFIKIPYSENRNCWMEVLDGKQRINTLTRFYENRFKYKGKYYNDLSFIDQNHFKNYNISWAETESLTNEQKYRYFLKLNIGGVPMSKKHLDKIYKIWEDEVNKNKK